MEAASITSSIILFPNMTSPPPTLLPSYGEIVHDSTSFLELPLFA